MGFLKGKDSKVTLGATTVVGMGSWSMPGIDTELLETTEFGDNFKTWCVGLKDGGEISWEGLFDDADSTGQEVLRDANTDGTEITNLRLYVSATSYWEPNQTGSPASYVNISSWSIETDKNSLATASFGAKLSGKMTYVG